MSRMLDIANLTVYYGYVNALSDVSIHVDEGEIITLIGSNGAGKTTTLMAVSGLVEKTGGSITVTHLHLLGFLDLLILSDCVNRVIAQELFDTQRNPDLLQERAVIRQHDQYTPALTRKETQGLLVRDLIAVGGQHFKRQIEGLIGFIGPVIDHLIESKLVPTIESGITILLFIIQTIEDQLRHFANDLALLDALALALNFTVDFLFLISQEDIDLAVFLHECLTDQPFQRFFYLFT